jgi:hypothetical protein
MQLMLTIALLLLNIRWLTPVALYSPAAFSGIVALFAGHGYWSLGGHLVFSWRA